MRQGPLHARPRCYLLPLLLNECWGLRTVFVGEVAKHHRTGRYLNTLVARGSQIVEAFPPHNISSAEVMACHAVPKAGVDAARTDVVVHVKRPCVEARSAWPHALHVLDLLDGPLSGCGSLRWAAVVVTHRGITPCRGVPTVVVPHHAVRCADEAAAAHERVDVLVVGVHPRTDLLKALSQAKYSNYSIVDESRFRERYLEADARARLDLICDTLASARVAIAWDQGGSYDYKPAERVINPQARGIPTIAYSGYRSFREYGTILCATFACLDRELQRLLSDETVRLRAGRVALAKSEGLDLPSVAANYSDTLVAIAAGREMRRHY